MLNYDDDRRKDDAAENQENKESVSDKLARVADEKEAEDAQKVDQPDPTEGYVTDSGNDPMDDSEEGVIPVAHSGAAGGGGGVGVDGTMYTNAGTGTPAGTPPIIVKDEDGDVEAKPVIDILDDDDEELGVRDEEDKRK